MLIEIRYNVTDVFMSTTETPVYVEISFEQPGGTSAVWGSITGTLSNQTDLQNALNAKLDESTIDGGTEGQILSKASATDFDFAWINNYAKYLATNVRNQTGSTIAAFQVVYISGATGNKPLISLADADTEATSSKTYGVTATSIANNGTGDVVTAGELSGINTSAFNEGDLLWLSTTAGGVVTTPPAEPAHAVFIGYVVRSHPTLGTIDVSIQNGYELNELHGVQITTPTDNQGLFYNSSNSLWENKTISTALGYTPVPTTRNITINGVTYDLSADRTYTISTGISGSGASGQVTYWTGASAVSGSNNLFWDNTNSRLGIGTNAPANALHISGFNTTNSQLRVGNLEFQTYSQGNSWFGDNVYYNAPNGFAVRNTGTTGLFYFLGAEGQFRMTTSLTAGSFITSSTAVQLKINANGTFAVGASVDNSQNGVTGANFVVTSNGRTLIGFTSDQGTKLAVNGDTLLRGSGATSATVALTVQNSSSTNLLTIDNSGFIEAPATNSSIFVRNGIIFGASNLGAKIGPSAGNAINVRFTQGTTNLLGAYGAGIQNSAYLFSYPNSNNTDAGTNSLWGIIHTFNPTSASSGYIMMGLQPTINQTGGANGITRGLYVNPTLTAAADWRSIEWSNNSGWGLYGAGTANNYLGGSLGIGSTSLTGVNFRVGKTITGATTSLGIWVDGRIQSDVTANAILINASAASNVSGFNTTNVYHFLADRATYSSTATNAYGYFVDGTITYATNNFGFYGNIASGTGRWNLYMNGTADNYLAGNLGIGITPTVRLHVSGDTILRGSGATSATTALTVQNSSSTNLFTVRNDGVVKIGDNIYNDNNSYLNVGKVGGGAARIAIANNSNYQDAMFVATSVSSGNINNWGFGQRRDTFFGNTIGSFQIVGGYIDNSGVGSAVGGGYRVPLICNPNGDVLINGGNANVVNGLIGLKVNAPTAHVDITASTTGNASLRIRSGTAPTSPNDGDIWFDGTDIKMRIGGVTKTFTLV